MEFITPYLHESRLSQSPQEGNDAMNQAEMRGEPLTQPAQRLQVELRQLELEYELARQGLTKTSVATVTAIIGVLGTTFMGFYASVWGKREFLSGQNIVLIIIAVAMALVALSALVFGRAAKLKARIAEKERELEIVLGERVR